MSCGQIVMFTQDLSAMQISRLVHIFWRMSRFNMFGQIFSEIDQQGVLSLLTNIKPGLMSKSQRKFNSADEAPVAVKETVSPSPSTSTSDQSSGEISELKEILLNLTHSLSQKNIIDKVPTSSAKRAARPGSKDSPIESDLPIDLSSMKPSSSTHAAENSRYSE
jgi:hypothetical protein